LPRAAGVARLFCRRDCNDGLPRYRLRRLDRADQARRLIQPGWHESSRTFSARQSGVNWKMAGLRAGPGAGAARRIDAENFSRR